MAYDFDDNLDDFFGGPIAPRIVHPVAPAAVEFDWSQAEAEDAADEALAPREFVEICRKCGGTGLYRAPSQHGHKCFVCKGAGRFVRKTSPEARAKARVQAAARKEKAKVNTLEAFAAEHPDVAAWIEARRARFDFAAKMHDDVVKWGSLTEGKLAACRRMAAADAERDANRAAEAQARVTSAPAVETDRLMAAFNAAKAARLKYPKMRFEGFVASLAPANGKNAGAVYLKSGDIYLGKIADGRFQASRECSPAKREAIVATMADPLAAAVAYGKQTGTCCCCGRELENEESVRLGIGPICRDNFGL